MSVNGQTVTELGTKADPEVDNIKINGQPLGSAQRHVYIVLNKPKGHVTTVTDPEGRPTVMDLVPGVKARIYPVGRLDYLSEGLLLLTNDGALAQKLTHASSHVPKRTSSRSAASLRIPTSRSCAREYSCHLIGHSAEDPRRPTEREGRTAPFQGGKDRPARIKLVRDAENPWYEITLIEGRNRQIRRMFKQIGHDVEKIRRVRYGPLELDIEPGKFRHLTAQEVARLKSAHHLDQSIRASPASNPAAIPAKKRNRRP